MELGYYRQIEKDGDSDDYVGELFYLTEIIGNQYHVVRGEDSWDIPEEKFLKIMRFAPDGLQERQSQMADLMGEVHACFIEQDNLLLSSSANTPHLDEAGQAVGFDLVPTKHTALQMKDTLRDVKTVAAKTQLTVKNKTTALQEFLKEQQAIMAAKMGALNKQIKLATEAISVLQTYLGTHEEIVNIKKGTPAAADTIIHMRQLLLFMDEECTIAAEEGGIDCESIEQFDKWLCDPKHRDQVIPEQKAIVALKIRRTSKEYKDEWESSVKNAANRMVYILIRNGENLYRIYTELRLGGVLFPTKDEFEEFFYEKRFNWDKHKDERISMTPGSRSYMQAMEKAESVQREYFKVLILIQGILDRTKIFEPMPIPELRVNICNLEDCTKYIAFIYDAENLLTCGKLTYDEWLKNANSKINVGIRVIGKFRSYYSTDRDSRITPKNSGHPNQDELYTIEGQMDGAYFFRFDRGEIWSGYQLREAKRRASYKVHISDKFIINFDSVTTEEVNYYINSRINRHHYIDMIPLMRLVVKLKEKEAKEEEPFRLLLISEICKAHKVEISLAAAKVDELIQWWKFKNLTHRALKSEDAKAIRMIVSEFGMREKLNQQTAKTNTKIVDELIGDSNNTLAIWSRTNNEYIVFRWKNTENIYIREELWKLVRNELKFIKANDWSVVDKRYLSWNLLYHHIRWDNWKIGIRENDYLTDPEIQAKLEFGLKDLTKPLIAVVSDNKLLIYHTTKGAIIPKKNILTGEIEYPELAYVEISHEKKKTGITYTKEKDQKIDLHSFFEKRESIRWPWDSGYKYRQKNEKSIYRNDSNIAYYLAEEKRMDDFKVKRNELAETYEPFLDQINEFMENRFFEEKRIEFFEQFNDNELWEIEKKKKWESAAYQEHLRWLEEPLKYLVQQGIEVHGLTVRKMTEKAEKCGWKGLKVVKQKGRQFGWHFGGRDDQERVDEIKKELEIVADIIFDKQFRNKK
jgi:hypothetical protein